MAADGIVEAVDVTADCARGFVQSPYLRTRPNIRSGASWAPAAGRVYPKIHLDNAPKRRNFMGLLKWLGGAAVGLGLAVAGSSAFAVTIGFSQVGD